MKKESIRQPKRIVTNEDYACGTQGTGNTCYGRREKKKNEEAESWTQQLDGKNHSGNLNLPEAKNEISFFIFFNFS